MTDYALTPGERQQLQGFLNAGKAVYLEGNDFGAFHKNDPIYGMFGCGYVDNGAAFTNISKVQGQSNTLFQDVVIKYSYGVEYPDQSVDVINNANGGALIFTCHKNKGRAVAYSGSSGDYRAIHSTFWLGALKDQKGTHTKNQVMAEYMAYLKGDSLLPGMEQEISASSGGAVSLFLESEAFRPYAVLGTLSGTAPGIPIGSVILPLNYDLVMAAVVELWNTPICDNFLGVLDARGQAQASFNIIKPFDPALAGQAFNFAFLLTGPKIDFASNAIQVEIIP